MMQEIVFKTIFCLLGLAAAGGGVFSLWKNNNLKKLCTEEAEGVVSIDYKESGRTGQRERGYRSVFTYYVNKEKYVRMSDIKSGDIAFSEGQRVRVFYDPTNPERIYVPEEKKSAKNALVAIIAGIAIIVLAFFARQ